MKRTRKIWMSTWMLVIYLFISIAFLHRFIANDRAIVAENEKGIFCPVCVDRVIARDRDQTNLKTWVLPLIRNNPYTLSPRDRRLPPLSENHLLGTDSYGRDVAARLVWGAKNSLWIGFFAIGVAFIIALIVGSISGYFHKSSLNISLGGLSMIAITLIVSLFYSVIEISSGNEVIGIVILLMGGIGALKIGKKLNWGPRLEFKPQVFTDGLIYLRESIPGIFLVLGGLMLFRSPSIWNIVIIIGVIGWGGMARFIRAEIIEIKKASYYHATVAQGIPAWRRWKSHILPNALDPVVATIAFSVASAILVEASLSFLGVGLPVEEPTWGGLLADARKTGDWWTALFPGLCILILLMALHKVADNWNEKYT